MGTMFPGGCHASVLEFTFYGNSRQVKDVAKTWDFYVP